MLCRAFNCFRKKKPVDDKMSFSSSDFVAQESGAAYNNAGFQQHPMHQPNQQLQPQQQQQQQVSSVEVNPQVVNQPVANNIPQPTNIVHQPFVNFQGPNNNVQQPSNISQQPATNFQQPANITHQQLSDTTQQQPINNFHQPSENFQQQPTDTSQHPVIISQQPTNTPQLPTNHFQQPSENFQQSQAINTPQQVIKTFQEPTNNLQQSSLISQQPTQTFQEPLANVQQPIDNFQQQQQQPPNTIQQPANTFHQQPTSTFQEPVTHYQQPIENIQQPQLTNTNQEPTIISQQPTNTIQEPVNNTQQTTNPSQQLTQTSQEPVNTFREATNTIQEPSIISQQPATEQPEQPTNISVQSIDETIAPTNTEIKESEPELPLPSNDLSSTVERLFGTTDSEQLVRMLFGKEHKSVDIPDNVTSYGNNNKIDIRAYSIPAEPEQNRAPRVVRVCAIQHSIVLSTTASVTEQRTAIHNKVTQHILAAAAAGAQIICLQEAWPMPFAFCTREHLPWTEFAESAFTGLSTKLLSELAAQHKLVIISPILERDEEKDDVIWNTAVVINNDGRVMGRTRKNHIPSVADFNETTYYGPSNMGHLVFETAYARIAVNICYGRHHPLNWTMFALNGADIIFNPSATVGALSEPLWFIEARNAAIANHCYTVAINRVGTETFPHEFTSGNGKPAHKDFGHFYGSSYVAAPDGSRTTGLARDSDGILLVDMDLNLNRQMKDKWGFRKTQRLELYGKSITDAAHPDYKPDIRK